MRNTCTQIRLLTYVKNCLIPGKNALIIHIHQMNRADILAEGSVEKLERIDKQDLALATTARLARFVANLNPGDRLPTERELCERLGVGRSTLREAMGSLAFIGAVQTRQGSGTYVSTQEDAPVERLIGLALMLQRSSVHEIVEVRRLLEIEAARLAAERHDAADRAALESVMQAFQESASDPGRASHYDMQYHVLLARASHNTALVHFLNGMRALLEIWINRAVNTAPVVQEIVREHNDILRAIFNRKRDHAAAYMLIHMTNAAERLFAVVGQDQSAVNYISLLLPPEDATHA
jgi:GntR family transcriptional repressor for pyruvate dehydrogenase complex